MDLLCKSHCLEFIKELSLHATPKQWGTTLLSLVIFWLISNILLLNRWVFLKQCQEAHTLMYHTMQVHISRQQIYGARVFERLAVSDDKFQFMLASVLEAKTQIQQAAYSKRIDILMNTSSNTRQYKDERQIFLESGPLIDALNFRRWRGMLTDPDDIEMILLVLTHCKRIMAMQHSVA